MFMRNRLKIDVLKNFFLGLSLNKKLILMMLCLSALLLSILLTLHWQMERALVREFENQTAELTRAIQVGVEKVTGSYSTRESGLESYLKTLKSKGIEEISVISATEQIIASSNPTKVGLPVGPKRKELIIKAALGTQISEEGKTYNVMIPVIAGRTHYGYIHLQINAEDISGMQKRNTIKMIIATLLVIAFGIFISILLALWYTEPIRQVVEASKRVAAGDLDVKLPVDRKDELGDLTENFNNMVQRLREKRQLEERLREAEHLSALGRTGKNDRPRNKEPLELHQPLHRPHQGQILPRKGRSGGELRNPGVGYQAGDSQARQARDGISRLRKPLKMNIRCAGIEQVLKDVLDIVKTRRIRKGRHRRKLRGPAGCDARRRVDEDLCLQHRDERLPRHVRWRNAHRPYDNGKRQPTPRHQRHRHGYL